MKALVSRGGGRYALEGELTFATVPAAWQPAVGAFAGEAEVRIDLAGITRVDSAGIALLVEMARAVRRVGGALHLERAPPQLMSLAEVGGLDKVLPFTAAGGAIDPNAR